MSNAFNVDRALEIMNRIMDTTKKREEKKEVQEEEKRLRKEGIRFVHDNRIPLVTRFFHGNWMVVFGADILVDDDKLFVDWTWAACSPDDKFNLRKAKSLIGQRLLNRKNNNKVFRLETHDKGQKLSSIMEAVVHQFHMVSLLDYPGIPDKLKKEMVKRFEDPDSRWQWESC